MFPLIHYYLMKINNWVSIAFARNLILYLKILNNLLEKVKKSGKSAFFTFLHRNTDADPLLWMLLITGFLNLHRQKTLLMHLSCFSNCYKGIDTIEISNSLIHKKSSTLHSTISQIEVTPLFFLISSFNHCF